MIRVTVWNENVHEKEMPEVRKLHPEGLHGTVAAILAKDPEITVRTATLDDPECGLTEEVLKETDVLFWWGHAAHQKVPDEVVERVYNHVLCGMGLVVMHSGHHSKIFRKLCGTPCNLTWHDDARERIFTVNPAHPIAQGIPAHFEIAEEECYGEPFSIPEPDAAASTAATGASSTSSRATRRRRPTLPRKCIRSGEMRPTGRPRFTVWRSWSAPLSRLWKKSDKKPAAAFAAAGFLKGRRSA